MHDIQGHLAVVVSGSIHPHAPASSELGGELGGFAHHDHPACAIAKRDALCPACRRLRAVGRPIGRSIRKSQERRAGHRPDQGLAEKCFGAIDPLGRVPTQRDGMVEHEPKVAREYQTTGVAIRVYRVGCSGGVHHNAKALASASEPEP